MYLGWKWFTAMAVMGFIAGLLNVWTDNSVLAFVNGLSSATCAAIAIDEFGKLKAGA